MENNLPYDESSVRSLEWDEHIRLRPGMYIGKLGDGSQSDDGIYVLLKEVIDNSIDEFVVGAGKTIEVEIGAFGVRVRDYGRGIPLGAVVDCVSRINTGAKYDSIAFQKSVGLNGVGTKAVNALSACFVVESFREGKIKRAVFRQGRLTEDFPLSSSSERTGTRIEFLPDELIFRGFLYRKEVVEAMLWNYAFLNRGLTLMFNGQKFRSEKGLADLLGRSCEAEEIRYPIVHLEGKHIEVALTHGDAYGEDYFSFVNGQHTTQGGTHLAAFREALVKTLREYYKKEFDPSDIRTGVIGAISIRIDEPVFESQTKTKLGSTQTGPEGMPIRSWILDFVGQELDNYLHRHPATADALLRRIQQSERERKEMAGIKKLANERAKKANLHNRKLRDCKIHASDPLPQAAESSLFITEGDSASGSLTKARNPQTQAVFSLKGKPLNCFGLSKKIVYENEEFNLLQHALNIEDSLDDLRYNRVVIATDADVDGKHIRLLLLTFFLQFFPDLIRRGHLHILQTPLFRVRNKKETIYCYNEPERLAAIARLGSRPEITRFKGLGEISPDEFEAFIGKDIRLEPVTLKHEINVRELLAYYMGKNTPERQQYIVGHLVVEKDKADALLAAEAELAEVVAV